MSQDQDQYFMLLRKSYDKLANDFLVLSQQKKLAEHMKTLQEQTAKKELSQQKSYYEGLNRQHLQIIQELQTQCKRFEGEESLQNKKEFRKYVEGINQKDVQNKNLKRQIQSFKSRISSLEEQINNLETMKDNFEVYISKATDQIRTTLKENLSFLQDLQNQKMIMESKFRQLKQKANLAQHQKCELETQITTLRQNYGKLKELYRLSKEQFIEGKYELEKLKELSLKGVVSQGNNLFQKDPQILILKEIQGIIDLKTIINHQEDYISQTHKFSELNRELTIENTSLKQRNRQLQNQMETLKSKLCEGADDEILKLRQPSLYDFLRIKGEQVAKFERQIQQIETFLQEKDDQVNKILSQLVLKGKQCNCEKQKQVDQLLYQNQQIKKKNNFFVQHNLKQKNQTTKLETKLAECIKQLRELFEFKRKKIKSLTMKQRCYHCFHVLGKVNEVETCTDCKKQFHNFYCFNKHKCDAFDIGDNNSIYSGSGVKM